MKDIFLSVAGRVFIILAVVREFSADFEGFLFLMIWAFGKRREF